MMKRIVLGALAVGLVACTSSAEKQKQIELTKCPPRAVQMVRDNQIFLEQSVELGKTPVKAVSKRKGVYRKASVSREGVTMDVVFLVTNLKSCGWVSSSWDSLTPVMVQDGVIVGVGSQTLRDMTANGWVIKDATWPWQDYDFGYLPKK